MTEDEVVSYLGFPPGTKMAQRIIDGMQDVPVPHDDASHITAFRAFCKCSGMRPAPSDRADARRWQLPSIVVGRRGAGQGD